MTIAYKNQAKNGSGTGSTASVTHGFSFTAGDLIVAVIHRNNDTTAIDVASDAGGTWNEAVQDDGADGSFTSRFSVQWKIATGSEPTDYSWGLNVSTRWAVIVKQFSTGDTVVVDTAWADVDNSASTSITAPSISVSAGAVAIAVGMQDHASASISSVDNSYANNTDQPTQSLAVANRVFTSAGSTGATVFTSNNSVPGEGGQISFVEDAGGPSGSPINYYAQQ